MAQNNSNNGIGNKNQMQELLSKIQKVSNEEYQALYTQILELLDESNKIIECFNPV